MIKAMVLRAAGTNCNNEAARAMKMAGAEVEQVHINELIAKKKKLSDYKIIVMPGGFSYGDDLGGGKILANQIKHHIGTEFDDFIQSGKLVLGICNGFQVLMRLGYLPGAEGQTASLTTNDSGKFECRWVYVKNINNSLFTAGINLLYIPVAHGEGKFVLKDNAELAKIMARGQIALKYVDETGQAAQYPYNPNGSVENIAGITNEKGNVMGMMPHPERHLVSTNSPQWPRVNIQTGLGIKIFQNMVKYAKENL